MSFKKYATISLLASLTSSAPNPDYKPIFHEINPKIILKQLTQKQIQEQKRDEIEYSKHKYKNTTYHIIKIDNNKNTSINITSTNTPKYLEEIIHENNRQSDKEIIAAINGSFLRDGKTIGLVQTNGEELSPNQRIRGSGYFTVKDDNVKILRELCDTTKYDEILQSFPLLIYDNEKMRVENERKSYRAAIAKDTEKNLYFIITETNPFRRNTITLIEFTEFLKTQNYTKALNLDGGRSAQMHFNNYNIRNHRRINNAITISRRNK
ncbi:MAG: phosphodiester glycosidase family protein [Candidatus Woesearchaeota archaeon]